ncbi:DUF7544 domain-containing protein [Streptosporangium sp. KLBMP 9127]|nr:glycerophosphoryl diester phosphodiesterase membrane domain-containing protein [Streptosporangium sp. KLBMP 9127]
MSDGHGSPPEQPPGWAAEQPPPYGGPGVSPWTVPGAAPGADAPAPPPGPPHRQAPPYPPYPQHPDPRFPPHGFRPPPPALRPGIIPLRPLGLGDILDGTIKLIRSNPKAVLGLSAIAAALGAIPVGIGQAVLLGTAGDLFADPALAEQAPSVSSVLGVYAGTFVSLIVQFVAVTLLSGVLTRILGRAVFGGNITAGEAWRLTRSRVPALFGLVLLTGLLTLVPLVLLVLLIIAVAAGGGSVLTVALLSFVSIVLAIGYTLIITTRFAFAAPAIVLERLGVIAGMRRSWRLVTGDFWRVFGILLLTSLLVGMIGSVFTIPFTIAGTLIGATGGGTAVAAVLTAVLIAVGGTLGSMIVYPVQAGVNGLLYADRRMRGEAFDLVLQTAAIEQQRQGWVPASADDLWDPGYAADRDQRRP